MRTTLTLDPDVADKVKKSAAALGKPLKIVINSALRVGLEAMLRPSPRQRYRTKPRPLGMRPGYNYDKISELIAITEGEDYR